MAPHHGPGQMSSGPSDAVWISNGSTNIAGVWQDGMDVQMNYDFNTQGMGRLRFSLAGTYISSYVSQSLPTDTPTNYVDGYSRHERLRALSDPQPARLVFKDWNASIGHTYLPSIDDSREQHGLPRGAYHTFRFPARPTRLPG